MAQVKYCLYCGQELSVRNINDKAIRHVLQRTVDMFIGIIL
jgi:hypothetical protein